MKRFAQITPEGGGVQLKCYFILIIIIIHMMPTHFWLPNSKPLLFVEVFNAITLKRQP